MLSKVSGSVWNRESGDMSQSKVSGLWIDGNWVRGTRSMEVRHKYHDRVLGEIDIPSQSQIDLAIRSAAQAARTMRLMPLHRRAQDIEFSL